MSRVRDAGFELTTNWYVSMDTPADRFVSSPPYAVAHLKLAVGDSVATSVGLAHSPTDLASRLAVLRKGRPSRG